MTPSHAIRLLQDPPLNGSTNMARDESLLVRVGERRSAPTLRLYRWDPPTISLGYFQRYADYAALPPPLDTLAVVRRQTGGGAILHDLELTYSLTLPLDHELLGRGPNRVYELVHDAVRGCCRDLGIESSRCGFTDDSGPHRGPFFCFARRHRYDLVVGDDKVAGSAQRRTRSALLQHGSIIAADRFDQPGAATLPLPLDDALAALRQRLPAHLARLSGARIEPAEWSDEELEESSRLFHKYAGEEWTRRT